MSYSVARSLKLSGILILAAVAGEGCSVKGIQSSNSRDGGADAGGRAGGKSDARGKDAAAGRITAGNSGGPGGAGGFGGFGGFIVSIPGGAGTSFSSPVAGTLSSGGSPASSSRKPDAGVVDAYRPDTKDAAGGTGGSKVDAWVADAYRADTRDAPRGGSGGAAVSSGSAGSSGSGGTSGTGSRDAWVPDTLLPDAYVPPDAPFDTPVGGSGGTVSSGGTGGTSSSSISSSMPALHIYSFNVVSGSLSGTEIEVTEGKSATLVWDVTGATTKEINQGVGMVTGSSEVITVTDPVEETTLTYTLTVTNSVNDASTTFETAHADVKITVVPLPTITSFTAVRNPDDTFTLTPVFVGGEARINHEVGPVTSEEGINVTPTEPITYTLTVKNRLNDSVTANVTVGVMDAGVDTAH